MLFRFIGRYTNGHTQIASCGVVFVGNEPSEVTDADAIRRLSGHPEFERIGDAPAAPVVVQERPRKRRQSKGSYHA